MPQREGLSRFAKMAAGKISAPTVMICRKNAANLEIICSTIEETSRGALPMLPLDMSICQHVIEMKRPLAIEDAFAHPLLKSLPHAALADIGAYLGVPLCLGTPDMVGTLCAVFPHRHRWSDDEVDTLTTIARAIEADLTKPAA